MVDIQLRISNIEYRISKFLHVTELRWIVSERSSGRGIGNDECRILNFEF